MNLGRVIGRVVTTVRSPGLEGVKFLIMQPLTETLEPRGLPIVACDSQYAGIGDLVHWIGGREACYPLPKFFVPVDATIVGHVEEVDTL